MKEGTFQMPLVKAGISVVRKVLQPSWREKHALHQSQKVLFFFPLQP